MKRRPQRLRRIIQASALCVAVVAAMLGGWVLFLQISGNIHVVDHGVFRSGQLSPARLEAFVAAEGIKTVINLRGAHPGAIWFEAEKRAVEKSGARLVSVRLSANHMPDDSVIAELLGALGAAQKPLLIHCNGGADRTGLTSALYLVMQGRRPSEAEQQLSIRYGHFPWLWSRSGAMDLAFVEAAPMARASVAQ